MDDETKKKDGGRRRIARTAVPPIGADKPLRATHRGNFKDAFGIDVDCYVLDDEQKTGVISKRGMGLALGMGESGSVFSYFIGAEKMVPYVGSELQQKLDNPLIFQWTVVGANAPLPKPLHGYDVLILLEVCKAIVKAADAGVLGKRHEHIVKQANVIPSAAAKHGITQLVYALSGYDQTKEEAIAAFKRYVAEEARGYEKEFPDELYDAWYRIYQLQKPCGGMPGRRSPMPSTPAGSATMTDITADQIRAHRETEHPIGQCWCDVALGDRTFAHTTIEEARRRVVQAIKARAKEQP